MKAPTINVPPPAPPDPQVAAQQVQADQNRMAQIKSGLADTNLNFARLFGTGSLFGPSGGSSSPSFGSLMGGGMMGPASG